MPALSMPPIAGTPRCLHPAAARLGEGTCWSPRLQSLWWVDILGKRLFLFRASDGSCREWAFDEEVSAVAECRDGPRLVLTLRHGLARFDPETGAPPVVLQRPPEEPATNRFNDGKCDAAGRFWGGTMDFDCVAPSGAFYRFDPDGGRTRVALDFAVTNGPTWSLDQRTMWINDTVRGRVQAFDFDAASGALSNEREWLRFARGDGVPDGMTTDAAGRIWIAHWGGACISCHDPVSAAELGRVRLPVSQVTNCAFGGPDFRTLFITSAREGLSTEQLAREPLAGGLFAVEIGEAGVAAGLFAG